MGSKILTLLTSLTLVANSAVAQNQTLTLLDQCQGGEIDVLVSLYNDGCKQNITTVLRYAGLDTAAQCPEAKATLACIKKFPEQWNTAVEKCDLIWSDTPCVSRYTTKGLSEFINKSCDAQVAATLGNFTANGANNGSCVSLINATLTAPAAKDCPAPAKVQACFKSQQNAWEELLQTCPDAFSSSKCLNAFNLLTFNAFLNSTIPNAAGGIGFAVAPWLMSAVAAVVVLLAL